MNIDGKPAQIRSVGAGRVQVDYNHPFAGKTLIYDLTVEKILESDEDRVRNIIHKRIPTTELEKFVIKIHESKMEVEIPEDAFFLEGLQVAKRTVTADVEKYLPKIETVAFLEIFKKPVTPSPAAAVETKAAAPVTEPAAASPSA